jgi:hypothetical protein
MCIQGQISYFAEGNNVPELASDLLPNMAAILVDAKPYSTRNFLSTLLDPDPSSGIVPTGLMDQSYSWLLSFGGGREMVSLGRLNHKSCGSHRHRIRCDPHLLLLTGLL